MPIFNVHKSIIVMNSIDTRFSRNVFEALQKTCSTCFIGSKTTRRRLVVLNPIKHSWSFFKHYLNCYACNKADLSCFEYFALMYFLVLRRTRANAHIRENAVYPIGKIPVRFALRKKLFTTSRRFFVSYHPRQVCIF